MIDTDVLPFFLKIGQKWNSFWDLSTFTEKKPTCIFFLQHNSTINLDNEMAT